METHNLETGEVLSPSDDSGDDARNVVAADGGTQPKRSGYLSDVIRMLDEGQFNADASEDMRELSAFLHTHAKNNKGKAKGTITITLDFVVANSAMVVVPKHTVKKPVEKRDGTMLFLAENGSLGINPPSQMPMFGNRQVRDSYIPAPGEQTARDV